jgi:glucose-6-phosphate-specific signal transduction histidine kinase
MVFGMSLETYTLVHVIISLAGIVTGLIVVFGMLGGKRLNGLTALFLITTVLTSATGFGFPFDHLLPSHKVGIISLVVLAIAILARYPLHLAGPWRWIYAVTAVMALYLNCFVLVVQGFLKIPALHSLAPNGKEPPFAIAQGILLVLFIVLGVLSVKKFHPEPA